MWTHITRSSSLPVLSLAFVVLVVVQISSGDEGMPSGIDGLLELLKKEKHNNEAKATANKTSVVDTLEAADSEDFPSAMQLLKEYAKDYVPGDLTSPVVETIASWMNIIKGDGSEGKSVVDSAKDLVSSAGTTQAWTNPAIAKIPTFVPSSWPSQASTVTGGWEAQKEWSYWDWMTSDGVWLAVVLTLFGAVPIILGLIPYVLLASNYWVLFNKFYSLHQSFWGLLGGQHDDGYGWTPQIDHGGWNADGWGWRQLN